MSLDAAPSRGGATPPSAADSRTGDRRDVAPRPSTGTVGWAGPRHLPAIDGLRALAVAVVVAYHLGRLGGGFVGVDLFFVISGFLITRNLVAEHDRTGRVSLVDFWRRRFRRLVPPLAVVLVATTVAARLVLPSWRLGELRLDALAALGYVANWRFVAGGESYFAPGASPLRHTWSLAVEEQFYVLWPLVALAAVAVAGRRGRRASRWSPARAVAVTAGVVTAASALWMVVVSGWGDPSRTYYGTDTRLFALTAGALAGAACGPVLARLGTPGDEGRARRASRTALVALALLVPFAVWGSAEDPWFARGGFQAVAALSVVAVVGLAAGGGTAVGVLGSPVAAWVGRRSYGIYLWSWPVQVLVEEGTALRGWRVDATVVVATLVLAAVSYALVERPLLRPRPAGVLGIDAGHTRSRVPVLALGTVATVAVVLVSTAGATEPPAPTRISDEEAVAAALAPEPAVATSGEEGVASTGRGAPAGPADGRTTPFDPDAPLLVGEGEPAWTAPAPEARAGAGRPRLRAMVAGDSTAWTLGYDLTDEVHAAVGISNRAMIGCGILPPDARPIVGGVPGTYPERCAEQLEAEAIGLGGDPDVALLWIGAWEVYDQEHAGVRYQVGTPAYARFLEELLAERVARYRSHGVPTVLTLVPCFGDQHPRLGPERTDRARAEWVDERIRAVAEANRGWVRLVDPSEALCTPDGRHRTHAEDGTPLRYDGAHFDRTSASWLWDNWLVDRLGDAFEGAS